MTREEFEHIQYAKDKDGNLVFIDDVVKGETYYCQFCGEIVIPKRGNIKIHHFAHKNVSPSCSYETYLHKLAKEKIYNWLVEKKSIIVEIKTICPVIETCGVEIREKCNKGIVCIKSRQFDIKKYFHPVGIEKQVDKFVADILMESNDERHIPLLIEIFVNHKCSDDKINSGYKIIEFNINSEEDIDLISKSNKIFKSGDNVFFYGFKTKDDEKIPECYKTYKQVYLEKEYTSCTYTLLNLKDGWIKSHMVSKKNIDENDIDSKDIEFQVIFKPDEYVSQKEFASYSIQKGFNVKKQCKLCKYFCNEYGLCCLYKKFNTPMYPYEKSTTYAFNCQYYRNVPIGDDFISKIMMIYNK